MEKGSKYCLSHSYLKLNHEMNQNDINPLLKSLGNDSMGFLNEIQMKFPNALSFASGRPDEDFFDTQNMGRYFKIYTDYISQQQDELKVINGLGQYNKARGIINELASAYLSTQYGIKAEPHDILINVGSQEGMLLSLMCLFDKEKDILAVEDPTYVGITDYAKISGQAVEAVKINDDGLCLATLEKKVLEVKDSGKRIKAVYVIPDFQNPTGVCMPIENRHALLEMARRLDFYIIEDNAYGDFALDSQPFPTLKSMDVGGRVIYLHSMSKIIYPSLRIGILVAGQSLSDGISLASLMAKIKGYTTVNTPALPQAVLGGVLLENGFDLRAFNKEKIDRLRLKRNAMLSALHEYFPQGETAGWLANIHWNTPQGGFFLGLKVPFSITEEHVYACAKDFGVIFTPMSFFYLGKGGENEIRLAFSYAPLEKIKEGIERLSKYLRQLK
jgi:(S)-3,5-dihydroxyphenylglycine transaminase